MKTSLVDWAGTQPSLQTSRALDPLAAEIIGARFCKLLGIGTAEDVVLAGPIEAKAADRLQWVIKPVGADGRAKADHPIAAKNLLIRKIPGAISVHALGEQFGVYGSRPHWTLENDPEYSPADFTKMRVFLTDASLLIHLGLESLNDPKGFFQDFHLPSDVRPIIEAINWNSEAMLAIHSARLFLGSTVAHSGNVLVDASGRLYSVDHELVTQTDHSEFKMLDRNVRHGSRAHRALKPIARIKEYQLEELFLGLPAGVEWPLGSLEITLSYFRVRLAFWRALFGGAN